MKSIGWVLLSLWNRYFAAVSDEKWSFSVSTSTKFIIWQLSRNPPSNLSGLLFESFRAVGLQNRTVFEQQNRSTKGVLQIWWSRSRSIPKVKQCCLRKTKSQVLEDFSTVGKVKSRVQEVILDRKYQLGIIRKLDSYSQIVFYFFSQNP